VLHLGLVQQVGVLDGFAQRRVEDLFLDLRVHGQLHADLVGQVLHEFFVGANIFLTFLWSVSSRLQASGCARLVVGIVGSW
jgi:hypothetical protein